MPLHCEVHMTTGVHSKTYDFVPECIRGQIHFALAVNVGTGLTTFQQALTNVVRSRLRIRRGSPPAGAIAYRKHLLRLCMSRGARLVERRLALVTLPNGDWRRQDCVEVYLPEGVDCDVEQIMVVVSQALVCVLAGASFTVYPRHRWTRADESFDQVCLLEGIHGLASATFPIWAASLSSARRPGAANSAMATVAADAKALADVVADAGEAAVAPQPDPAGGAEAPSSENPALQAASALQAKFRAEQAVHRREALDWLQSKPLAKSLVVRQTMETLRRLLTAQLEMGGIKWDRSENAKFLRSRSANLNERRKFPIVEASLGTLEDRFDKDVWLLMSEPTLWENLLPSADQTVEMRGLVFRLLSSSRCWLELTLRQQHATFPVRMFRLLTVPEEAAEIASLPQCIFDPWSLRFVQDHSGQEGGLAGETALAKLELIARMAKLDISSIESLHASIRRRLYSRGVQTRPEALEEVSAEWVCDRARCSGARWAPKVDQHVEVADGRDEEQADVADPTPSENRRGGPWRAWVRKKSLGQHGLQDQGALAAEYRSLSVEERAALVTLGEAAQQQGPNEAGSGSFGLKARQVRRMQAKTTREAQVSRLLVEPASSAVASRGERCEDAVRRALDDPANRSLQGMLTSARSLARASSAAQLAQGRLAEEALARWEETQGKEEVDSVLEGFPNLAAISPVLAALPTDGHVACQFRAPVSAAVVAVRRIDEHSQRANLGQALLTDWASKHRAIMHSDCPKIVEPAAPARKTPPCYKLGMCVCSEKGQQRQRLRLKFLQALKATLPAKSGARKLLMSKRSIARLRGVRQQGESAWELAAAEEACVPVGLPEEVLYWHLGAQVFSPYSTSFRPLKYVEETMRESRRSIWRLVLL